jgi:hypothetical protein
VTTLAEEPWEPSDNFGPEPSGSFFGCLAVGCGAVLILTGGSCAVLALISQEWTMVLIALLILGLGVAAIASGR